MRLGTWIGIGLFAIAGAGCGGGSKPASYSDISASFAHPTGTLAATNADTVAMAYQTSLTAGANSPVAGRRLDQRSSAVTESIACPNGGTIAVNVSEANSSNISENWSYNNCCEAADCCLNGTGDVYFSAAGTAAENYCESFQITGTCSAQPVAESFSVCSDGTTGTISYLVQVGTDTFSVSGDYIDGSGTLTITGKNGTFTCTYTNDTGSCTGTSGTFAF